MKSVHLSWKPPANTGGTATAGYFLRQYQSGVLKRTVYVTTASTTITGLVAGGSYTFAVAAHSAGNYTSVYSAKTPKVIAKA